MAKPNLIPPSMQNKIKINMANTIKQLNINNPKVSRLEGEVLDSINDFSSSIDSKIHI